MAELTLNQIEQKLNEEFAGSGRRLIFWYDENREFSDEIEALNLQNAKIYRLEEDKLFYTKYFLEREDTETSYLIYAPFLKAFGILWRTSIQMTFLTLYAWHGTMDLRQNAEDPVCRCRLHSLTDM